MRTTLIIPDAVYRELKRRAAEAGKTISGLATELIRRGLSQEQPSAVELPPLPTFDLGPALVDVADRDALYDLFDRDGDSRSTPVGPPESNPPAPADVSAAQRDEATQEPGDG